MLVLANKRAIPVASVGRKAASGAKSLLRLTFSISPISQRNAPIATMTAMYLKLSVGFSRIYPNDVPISEGKRFFFGTAAAYDAPNGARVPRRVPLDTRIPHNRYMKLTAPFLTKSLRLLFTLFLIAFVLSIIFYVLLAKFS